MFPKKLKTFFLILVAAGALAAIPLILASILVYPRLPSLEVLTDYNPKQPLRIYTADGALLGEFGEERRALVQIRDVPPAMKQAILAAEDASFYSHNGVDYAGVVRAALANLSSGGAREGASTITMQVARNFFLSNEKTMTRKLSEVLLSWKIENSLTKDQILEIYLNQIYLGQRAYGFQAAAQAYYGKGLAQLSLAETAMLAGLPKAPARYNPVVNPKRAKERQEYVLRRMRDLGYISVTEFQEAMQDPVPLRSFRTNLMVPGAYVAEMVREAMYAQYGDQIYDTGMKVYTTIRKADQEAAVAAVVAGVSDYDARRGYRGAEASVEIPAVAAAEVLEEALEKFVPVHGMLPAVVLEASPSRLRLYVQGGDMVTLESGQLGLVRRHLGVEGQGGLRRGAVVRVMQSGNKGWKIVQLPQVEAAFVSLDPQTGAVRSLVGGFDFRKNKFNHVTQAWRQPGSAFKPFIYSAALERGFSPVTLVNDSPLSLPRGDGSGGLWEPKNYDDKFEGPIPLRRALARSRNLVSIRVLQAIGPQYAQDFITRFGFAPDKHPPYLPMALGSGSVTPMQMASAYAVFANGGYRIRPYFIERITTANGTVLSESLPPDPGSGGERVLAERNAFVVTSMLQEVIRSGTATRANVLGRKDLAGKTGTTNDSRDAWFCGYNSGIVAVSWMGYDQPRSLGGNETGGATALPMWIQYMSRILPGIPERVPVPPEGVTTITVDQRTGQRTEAGTPEFVYQLPGQAPAPAPAPASEPEPAPEPAWAAVP